VAILSAVRLLRRYVPRNDGIECNVIGKINLQSSLIMNSNGYADLNTLKGTFFFDPADRIYEDHFPGNPIVPGSLIVHAFSEAGRNLGFVAEHCTIKNFRFREFISPGEYPFSIELLPDQLKCRIYQGDKTLVTGILKR